MLTTFLASVHYFAKLKFKAHLRTHTQGPHKIWKLLLPLMPPYVYLYVNNEQVN